MLSVELTGRAEEAELGDSSSSSNSFYKTVSHDLSQAAAAGPYLWQKNEETNKKT